MRVPQRFGRSKWADRPTSFAPVPVLSASGLPVVAGGGSNDKASKADLCLIYLRFWLRSPYPLGSAKRPIRQWPRLRGGLIAYRITAHGKVHDIPTPVDEVAMLLFGKWI